MVGSMSRAFALSGLFASFSLGCGGGTLSYRDVDTPVGNDVSYGAPAATTYSFETEPELDLLGLRFFRSARCPVIPSKTVLRRSETLRGGKVISVVEHGMVRIAEPSNKDAACDLGYGQDLAVSLAVHRIGTTNARGYIGVNLTAELRERWLGAQSPASATVRVFAPRSLGSVDLGEVSLASLRDFDAGVNRLLAELEPLLAKGTAISGPEITRSYQLYEQLRALGFNDPRVKGVLARFWELFYGRKAIDSTQNLTRNLQALQGAQALLQSAGPGAIPLFMQVAVSSQSYDPRAFDWAQGALFDGLRKAPQACTGFDWRRAPSYGFGPSALLGIDYLRFAQGDDFWRSMSGVCSFVTR
jgi:hypothetical protein